MIKLGLRTRFLLSGAALVLITIASGVWSALAFARLSHVVGDTLRNNEQATAATAAVANALEREDDALLLWLSGDASGRENLASARVNVEASFARLAALLPSEREAAMALRRDIDGYQAAGDALVAGARAPDALVAYHRHVNPLLRHAVAGAGRIRDGHFQSTHQAATWARDEARHATSIVTGISLAALVLSVIVSFRLARRIVWPLRELTDNVDAIRHGDFDRRVSATSDDELGRLGEGFNRMAEHLAEFRRANIGAVVRAKETLEATLAALPDAVVVVDPEGMVSSANDVASRVLQSASATLPARVEDLPLTPAAIRALREALEGRRGDDSAMDLGRALTFTLDGKERRLLPRVVPVPGASAGAHGAVLVLYDVTDLVRLDEMRVELIAVASHELRTPLTTMRMTLLMLQEGASGLAPRQQDLLTTALLGVDQLATTIDEFLDLTRIEAGKLRLACDRIDVAALVGQAVRAMRPQCDEGGIELCSSFDADAPASIWGDAARLQVVISNILTNALKYTTHGGVVSVRVSSSTEADAPSLHLAVTDTGRGVPAEYRERIFEKFFRVEHHRGGGDEGVRGSGIGLYLSRQIVEAHRGRIWCEAGDGGRGATITVSLPSTPHSTHDFRPDSSLRA
ncbi:Signal transduction histidine kinase CheA [Minicystis rosea]|nr:Signal transduction histidine kinase CheA [Minicystis rosea]